jgi:hypothetical protein
VSETYAESRGHVRIIYTGPIEPHWEVLPSDWGDRNAMESFSNRVRARLLLLTPADSAQFPRNQIRCNDDAEREALTVDWVLG